MGRAGSISWPSHSLYLTPCDYFLGAFLEDIVHSEPSSTMSDLSTKLTQTVARTEEETLKKVYKHKENRLCFVLNEGMVIPNIFNAEETYFYGK